MRISGIVIALALEWPCATIALQEPPRPVEPTEDGGPAGAAAIDPELLRSEAALRSDIAALESADDAAIAEVDKRVEVLAHRLETATATAGAHLEVTWAARLVLDIGRPLDAERVLARAGERLAVSGNETGLARVAQHRAIACRMLGRFEEALEWNARAREAFARLGDERGAAGVAVNSANVLQEVGRFEEAETCLADAEARFRGLGDERSLVLVALNRANLYLNSGKCEAALQAYAEVESSFAAPGMENDRGVIAMNRALALFRLGRLEPALAEFARSAALLRGPSAEADRAILATNRAGALNELGRFEEALSEMEGAEHVLEKLGLDLDLAGLRINRAIVLNTLGRHEEALAEYARAAPVCERLGAEDATAIAIAGRAITLSRLSRHEEALADFDRAARHYERLGRELELAGVTQNRGDVSAALGRSDEALAAYDGAEAIYRRHGDDYGQADVAHDRAGVFLSMGRLDAALAECDRADANRRASEDRLFAAVMAHDRAAVLSSAGRHAEALASYERSANDVERLLRTEVRPLGEESSHRFRLVFRSVLSGTLRSLSGIEERRPEQFAAAYRVTQVFHGAGLTEILAERGRVRSAGVPDELRDEEEDITSRLRVAATRRSSMLSAPAPATLDERLQAKEEWNGVLAEIDDLARRRERLSERIRLRDRSYAAVVYPRAASLDEVRSVLPAGSALVEYFLDEGGAHAFVLTRNSIDVVGLGRVDGVRDAVLSVVEALTTGASAGGAADDAGKRLRDLGRRVMDPVLRALPASEKTDTLYISPDGDLCRIPFEALLIADSDRRADATDRPFLVSSFSVAYVHSGTALRESLLAARAEAAEARPRLFVGFANPFVPGGETPPSAARSIDSSERGAFHPLPRAAAEVLHAAGHFARQGGERNRLRDAANRAGGKGDVPDLPSGPIRGDGFLVFIGRSATEGALRETAEVKAATVLHFACHGRADLRSPALSFLLLAASEDGPAGAAHDGAVTLRDLRDLSIGADLVVLSACETNSGTSRPFEGIAGLSRAALAGGARSVLSTLWRVEDGAASDLVAAFYDGWLERGLSRVAALAEAKRAAARRGCPVATWSAYTLWDVPGG
jgi:CHAT domain-containing protein/predicted negative regulator of RcsB-dependent stress response